MNSNGGQSASYGRFSFSLAAGAILLGIFSSPNSYACTVFHRPVRVPRSLERHLPKILEFVGHRKLDLQGLPTPKGAVVLTPFSTRPEFSFVEWFRSAEEAVLDGCIIGTLGIRSGSSIAQVRTQVIEGLLANLERFFFQPELQQIDLLEREVILTGDYLFWTARFFQQAGQDYYPIAYRFYVRWA